MCIPSGGGAGLVQRVIGHIRQERNPEAMAVAAPTRPAENPLPKLKERLGRSGRRRTILTQNLDEPATIRKTLLGE